MPEPGMFARQVIEDDHINGIEITQPTPAVLPLNVLTSIRQRSRSVDGSQGVISRAHTPRASLGTSDTDTAFNSPRPSLYSKGYENYSSYTPSEHETYYEHDSRSALCLPKSKLEYSIENANDSKNDVAPAEPAVGPPPSTGPAMSKLHEIAFIMNLCLAQFLSLATLSQTVAPLIIIGDSVNVHDLGELSWFTAAYSLAVGTLMLPSGRLGDMFGHKNIFMAGWLWLAVWSVVTGFSYVEGRVMLSACRAMQGVGIAAVVPNAMALIGRTYPVGMKRSTILSAFGACGPTGMVTGAVFSSLLAELIWWPWVFWALAIASMFICAASYLIIPAPEARAASEPSRAKTFDYWGALMGVSGLVLVNFALNQAPIVGWSEPYILNLFFLGVVFMVAFMVIEYYFAVRPLVPIKELNRDAVFVLLCITCGWASHGIWSYYFFLFLETLKDKSALMATASLVPVVFTGVAFALSTPYLIKAVGPAWTMAAAMLCFCLGSILLATAPVGQSYWSQTFLSVLITPGGMNLSFPSGMILLSNAMPREHQGIAASFVATVVNYSISSGLGIAGTIAMEVTKKSGSVEAGYRGALYLSIGMAMLGLAVSMLFVMNSRKSS